MDILKEISEMKFGEAYKELAGIAYEETIQFVSEKKDAMFQPSQGNLVTDAEREIRERLPFA